MRLKQSYLTPHPGMQVCRKEENLTYEIETRLLNSHRHLASTSERRESHLWDWNRKVQYSWFNCFYVGKKRISPMRLKRDEIVFRSIDGIAVGKKRISPMRLKRNGRQWTKRGICSVGKKRISPMRLKQILVNMSLSCDAMVGKKRISPMRLKQ